MPDGFFFTVAALEGQSRAGELVTPRGRVPTPAFMPVATQGSVKGLSPDEVRGLGAHMVLGNAYHLYLRPGVEIVEAMGGLHRFMGWDGPILTDSGGYQAFSLGSLSRVEDSGITFRSHIDGSLHHLSPQDAIRIQSSLGADIAMCLDQCVASSMSVGPVKEAMERTHLWAARCKEAHRSQGKGALFGIVQGGIFPHLRRESVEHVTSLGLDGYAVGGLAVGESKEEMYRTVAQMGELLPGEHPRYLMGVGSPEDLVECVARGMDLFDCALPTRVARNGGLFTPSGRVDITNSRYQYQEGPVEDGCDCYTCRSFSAGYLRHLFKAGELLGLRLATIHNLSFVLRLMEKMRRAIATGTFEVFRQGFMESYRPTDEASRADQFRRRLASKTSGQ